MLNSRFNAGRTGNVFHRGESESARSGGHGPWDRLPVFLRRWSTLIFAKIAWEETKTDYPPGWEDLFRGEICVILRGRRRPRAAQKRTIRKTNRLPPETVLQAHVTHSLEVDICRAGGGRLVGLGGPAKLK